MHLPSNAARLSPRAVNHGRLQKVQRPAIPGLTTYAPMPACARTSGTIARRDVMAKATSAATVAARSFATVVLCRVVIEMIGVIGVNTVPVGLDENVVEMDTEVKSRLTRMNVMPPWNPGRTRPRGGG